MKNSRPDNGRRMAGMLAAPPKWLPCAALALLLALPLAQPAPARPELCEQAALQAASESEVPADVLLAIALVETGRAIEGRMRPWPWAANADGRGHWFGSADEAAAFARQRLAQGRPSFDLGCFQINWRWHGQHFDRPEALLEPLTSARYAAHFLSTLHDELGDWEMAAGAYHSRTPHLAQRYRARFVQRRAGLQRTGLATTVSAAGHRPETHRAAPRLAGKDREAGPRQRGQVALALLQPGTPARDPASLLPAVPAGNAPRAEALAGPAGAAKRPAFVDVTALAREPGATAKPAGAAASIAPPTPLPAIIPALAGGLP